MLMLMANAILVLKDFDLSFSYFFITDQNLNAWFRDFISNKIIYVS